MLFVVISLCAFVPQGNSASNLAIGKSYTVFPPPNYPLTAAPTDRTALTDGVYTDAGIIWTQKTTVGWQETGIVKITIDLKKVAVIDGITFSTAKGNFGDVNYPARIGAFVGPDEEHLRYVGDLAATVDQAPVKYQTNRFSLQDIGAKGRFVLLNVELNGRYLFCDEIEVFAGKQDRGRVGRLSPEEALRLQVDRNVLQGWVEQMQPQLSGNIGFNSRLAEITQRLRAADASRDDTRAVEAELLTLRGELLRAQFPGKAFLLEPVAPWGVFSPVSASNGVPLQEIALSLPQGGYDHASFVITNLADAERQVSITLAAGTAESPLVSLYQIPFVQSAAMEYVPDPLVPLAGSFPLRSGESKMIFVSAQGNKPGNWRNSLTIAVDGTKVIIPIESKVVPVALSKRLALNSVTWNYLDFEPTRDRKAVAMNDLFAHHAYVSVLASNSLALTDTALPDLFRMKQAFERQQGADKILLMLAFREEWVRTSRGKYQFLSDDWKKWFRTWYDRTMKMAVAAGVRREKIYLYPYDEIDEKEIDQFIAFAKWVRQEIPDVRLYATLGRKESEKALPYLDIAQVINDDAVLKKFAPGSAELWLYDAKGPAKSLSPYAYYRLLAWKAFLRGYKGIGFWAYADTGWADHPSSAWDDFDGKYPDFAVIYDGPNNSIISSRRWEAWRMGIEDYELLTMYAKAKGEAAAKDLAKRVLERTDDVTQADAVRRKILGELSNGADAGQMGAVSK